MAMSIKTTMRSRFPLVWRALRGTKWQYTQGVRKLYSHRSQQAEQQYHDILDAYSRGKEDFFFIQVGANDGV